MWQFPTQGAAWQKERNKYVIGNKTDNMIKIEIEDRGKILRIEFYIRYHMIEISNTQTT